jgi:hypothetical protein
MDSIPWDAVLRVLKSIRNGSLTPHRGWTQRSIASEVAQNVDIGVPMEQLRLELFVARDSVLLPVNEGNCPFFLAFWYFTTHFRMITLIFSSKSCAKDLCGPPAPSKFSG